MVHLFCRHAHGAADPPCGECRELIEFAAQRLLRCPHGERKPTCANCPIHCYRADRREQMRRVMRVAGPRMLLRHPWLTLRHWLDGFRRAPARSSGSPPADRGEG
jgi:hypothetical protein